MENSKKIEINDLENKLYFRIRLFDVEKGLDFVDNLSVVMRSKEFSIKPFLKDLLPLVDLMDAKGNNVVKESLSLDDCYGLFRNPLAVLDLGMAVLEFQKVFMTNSKLFQPLTKALENIWSTETLVSETK